MSKATPYSKIVKTDSEGETLTAVEGSKDYTVFDDAFKRQRARQVAVVVSMIVLVAIFILQAVGLASPWFKRVPFDDYKMYYYLEKVDYVPNYQKTLTFDECGDKDYDLNCNKLRHTSSRTLICAVTSVCIVVVAFVFQAILLCRKTVLKKSFLLANATLCLVSYAFMFVSWTTYISSFPYRKFCFYTDTEENSHTGCRYGTGVSVAQAATLLLLVPSVLLFSMAYPTAKCKGRNTSQTKEGAVVEIELPRSSASCYFTAHEFCTFLLWFILLGTTQGVMNGVFRYAQWPAYRHSHGHIRHEWAASTCINQSDHYYLEPEIFYYQTQCAWEYPLNWNAKYDYSWWTCCTSHTCSHAYDYTQLFESYYNPSNSRNSASQNETLSFTTTVMDATDALAVNDVNEGDSCFDDMVAMTQLSCHPLNSYFVNDDFNTKLSPSERLKQNSTAALCRTFCQEVYHHCKNLRLANHSHMLMKDVYSGPSDFCVNGLGSKVRREAFSDQCFSAGNRAIWMFAALVVVFNAIVI